MWTSGSLPLAAKLRLYEAAVVSVLSYGHESWSLDKAALSSLKGWNARCLSKLTGRSVHEECTLPTYNLTSRLLARRLRWAGHVLRLPDSSWVKQALCARADTFLSQGGYPSGFVLAHAPAHSSVHGLKKIAANRARWRAAVAKLVQ